MKKFKTNQKGITLIALIITIIVMLILVGVTINVALNGGLFGKAEKATFQTEVSTIREQLELAKASRVMDNDGKPLSDYSVIKIGDLEGLDEKTREEYKEKIVVDKDGNICYDPAKVTDEEERTWLEEIGIKPYTGKKENETYTFTIGDLAKRGLLSSGEEDGPTVRGTKEEFFPETVSEELKNSEYIFNGFDTDDITIKVYNLTCSDKKYTNWLESEGGSIEANSFALYIMEGTIIFVITDENGDIINANNYENYKNLEFTISANDSTEENQPEPPTEEGPAIYNVAFTKGGYRIILYKNGIFTMEWPAYISGMVWAGYYDVDGNQLTMDAWNKHKDATAIISDDYNTLEVTCNTNDFSGTWTKNSSKTDNYNPYYDVEKGIYKNSLYINASGTNAINISQTYIHLEQSDPVDTGYVIGLANFDKNTNERISVNEEGTVITYNGEQYTLITKEQMNSEV